jgi:type I site-specific restriction endonuclease
MSYFSQAHSLIRYVTAGDGQAGLRKSQIGALHATSAHFTLQERPAVVVLPTGVGKTAVLMLTPYMLCATRTLVITQSRFVRDQITQDYKALQTLKLARALPDELPPPAVFENKRTIRSVEEWETLRQYDAVIALPNSASPAYKHIPPPPTDLFDLVLIDEAHHSTAPTWNTLIDAFPKAHCVLFTATPFRRDGKEITSIGFSKKVVSTQGGTIMLPTTTTAGEFTGTSAGAVRDVLRERVQKAFAARRFTSEIFISVGGDWCWGYVRT